VLAGFAEDGSPIFSPNDQAITLGMMLNQTSGFGMEFGDTVQKWKKISGKGFVNSCKIVSVQSYASDV
jgi:hypothetical protein